MLAFIIRRLAQSLVVMFIVALVAFTMFNYVGDPIHQMVGMDTSFEERAQLREQLGLNDPMLVQFGRFVVNAAQGEFGMSYQHKRPVKELFAERLPATLELSMVAALYSLMLGIPLGVYTGLKRYGILSRAAMTFSLIGVSLPTFTHRHLAHLPVRRDTRLAAVLRPGGCGESGILVNRLSHTASGLKALILPSITLGMFQLTLIMRLDQGRNAGGASDRLYQVRKSPGPEGPRG